MIKFTAIKPVYNRSTKTFDLDVVFDADPIMAHNGYLVYDDIYNAIGKIMTGKLIQSWPAAKRQAVLDRLIRMGSHRAN